MAYRPRPVLFVVAGVLYYFTETQVKALFTRLASHFPASELIFDVCSPRGVKLANKRVIRDGGMGTDANLHWGLRRTAEIKEWAMMHVQIQNRPGS